MKKLLFVVNGHSGKGQIKNKLLDIIDIMIKEGYHVQVHTTQEREDATKVVREQAKYYDLVVCSGGDHKEVQIKDHCKAVDIMINEK